MEVLQDPGVAPFWRGIAAQPRRLKHAEAAVSRCAESIWYKDQAHARGPFERQFVSCFCLEAGLCLGSLGGMLSHDWWSESCLFLAHTMAGCDSQSEGPSEGTDAHQPLQGHP